MATMWHETRRGALLPVAAGLSCSIATDQIAYTLAGTDASVPRLAGSCSMKGNTITLSVVNMHATDAVKIAVKLEGAPAASLKRWRVLTADDIQARNTFDRPGRVVPRDVEDLGPLTLPPASVNVFTYAVQ